MSNRYPIIGIVGRSSDIGGYWEVARLVVTPSGFAWDGTTSSAMLPPLMETVEREARLVYGEHIEKLIYLENYTFFLRPGNEIARNGDFFGAIIRKEEIAKKLGRPIESFTIDELYQMAERRHWSAQNLQFGEDVIQLEGRKRLVRHYGKYQSGLSVLVERYQDYAWNPAPNLSAEMNVRFDGETSVMRGEYFVSKKGTKCFRVKADGPHLLIKSEWGGAFRDTRGFASWRDDIPKDALYFYRARSNGGGMGNDYLVLPVGYRAQLREEDVI